MTYRPLFVSEREAAHTWPDGRWDDSHWEDCAWTSALMLANAATGGKFPASLAEAEAARAAVMGPVGGTSIATLQIGVLKRWGTFPFVPYGTNTLTFDAFWQALIPGKGAMVMGRLSGLPLGHRLRRWQPDYTGGHAIYVQREAAEDRVWWMDPLGPTTGYAGEYASKGELASYYNAFRVAGSGVLLGTVATPEVSDMGYTLRIREFAAPRGFTLAANSRLNFYDPEKPGKAVYSALFPTDWTGQATGTASVKWHGPAQVPDSGGAPNFLEVGDVTPYPAGGVAADTYRGLLVVTATAGLVVT